MDRELVETRMISPALGGWLGEPPPRRGGGGGKGSRIARFPSESGAVQTALKDKGSHRVGYQALEGLPRRDPPTDRC